jgi:hypothetical protein
LAGYKKLRPLLLQRVSVVYRFLLRSLIIRAAGEADMRVVAEADIQVVEAGIRVLAVTAPLRVRQPLTMAVDSMAVVCELPIPVEGIFRTFLTPISTGITLPRIMPVFTRGTPILRTRPISTWQLPTSITTPV